MMRSTLSSWGTPLVNHTPCTPTSMPKEKVAEKSSTAFGLIPLKTSILTPSSGTRTWSCKFPLILLKLVVPMPGYKGSFCQFCDLISNYKMACYIKIRGCLQLNYLQVQCLIDLSLVWIHWYRILVNGKPIRQMKNQMRDDTPFPLFQPMRMYASIWNAEEWATQGGRIKTDWSQAPFTAFFRNYTANACVPHNRAWICGQGSGDSSWFNQELDDEGKQKLKEVDDKNKIYDYCTDSRRFPNGYPPECTSQ